MIAPWMLYVLAVSALLGLVAAMAEQVAVVQGWPRRWIWTGAVLLTVALVGFSPRRAAAPQPATARATEGDIRTLVGPEPRAARFERAPIVRWGALSEILDRPLRGLWLLGTVAVGALVVFGAATLARRRRQWRRAMVDGVPVFVAPADGPAVVGVFRQRVVVPEWSLALDDEARRMMLRHEVEHVRAGDPWLTQLMGIAVVALPWNLPLWWMLRRLRLAVEVDCDARVLQHTPRPDAPAAGAAREYGELLLTVATRQSRHLMAAPALLEHTTALGRRIMAMNPRFPRFPRAHSLVFASGALLLTAWAGGRQPPPLDLTGPAAVAVSVAAWRATAEPPLTIGQLRERLGERAPEMLGSATTGIVTFVRTADGVVRGAWKGREARGPLIERVAPGYGHGIEELLRAEGSVGFAAADSALFGRAAPTSVVHADAPIRDGVNASAVDVMRVPAGVVTPGVLYVFVITVRQPWREPGPA